MYSTCTRSLDSKLSKKLKQLRETYKSLMATVQSTSDLMVKQACTTEASELKIRIKELSEVVSETRKSYKMEDDLWTIVERRYI